MLTPQTLLQVAALPVIVLGLSFAVLFRNHLPDRRYVGYALIVLVIASNVLMTPLLPIDVMHKYTAGPLLGDRVEIHQVHFVDANGEEIQAPEELFVPKKSLNYEYVLTSNDSEYAKNYAGVLLDSAQRHRATIKERTLPARLANTIGPPSPMLSDSWTQGELRQYDEFVGVRVYRATAHTRVPPAPHADRVTDRELIAEFTFNNSTAEPDAVEG
jgi:hypothetical protein